MKLGKEKNESGTSKKKARESSDCKWEANRVFFLLRKQKWKVRQETESDRQHKTNREREEWRMSVADSLQLAAENRKHLRWN